MPRADLRTCKACGHRVRDGEQLTWGGYHMECGEQLLWANVGQMVSKSGPNWTKWRRNMAACVGGELLDTARANGNSH